MRRRGGCTRAWCGLPVIIAEHRSGDDDLFHLLLTRVAGPRWISIGQFQLPVLFTTAALHAPGGDRLVTVVGDLPERKLYGPGGRLLAHYTVVEAPRNNVAEGERRIHVQATAHTESIHFTLGKSTGGAPIELAVATTRAVLVWETRADAILEFYPMGGVGQQLAIHHLLGAAPLQQAIEQLVDFLLVSHGPLPGYMEYKPLTFAQRSGHSRRILTRRAAPSARRPPSARCHRGARYSPRLQ